MKSVYDEVEAFPDYSSFCLKSFPGGSSGLVADLVQVAATGKPSTRNTTCSTPPSPLSYLYPATSGSLHEKDGRTFYTPSFLQGTAMMDTVMNGSTITAHPSLEFNGKGTVMAPCAPDSVRMAASPLPMGPNLTCSMPAPIAAMVNLSVLPVFLRATLGPSLPNMGDCNLCNSAWCRFCS